MDDPTPTTTTPTPTTPAPSAVPPPASPPSWAPTTHQRDEGRHMGGIIGGLVLLGLGLWFFADRTLGLDLPDIRWGQLWPLILILIGAAILLGALRRGRR